MSDEKGNGSDKSPYASPAQRTAYENGRDIWGDECRNCHQRGHWQSECPQRWRGNNMRCMECGSAEHAMYNCPIYLEHQRRRELEEAARANMGDVERNVDHEEEEEDNESEDGSGVDDEED
mmetsp:Transcript_4936/g.7374  ORF Transcript_4936/g.7374 Transcript_4936/m.7374 type:complete len:121 (+) Transcript_4936:160-522(+)